MKELNVARAAMTIVALAVVGIGMTGCSIIQEVLGQESVTRDAQTEEVVEAGSADVFNLHVGDCFDDDSVNDTGVTDVPAVPCAEPHDNEIYYIFDLPDGDFPGVSGIETSAYDGCYAQFEGFVGVAYDASVLDYWPIYPSEESWNSLGDREVICSVYEPQAKVTGTLAGAGR